MDHLDGLLDDLPERVLVVAAHPDDIDFGCAGTVARLTDAGVTVTYAIATSGEAGRPEDVPRDEVMSLRQREQRAAAAIVGVDDVTFLDQPDGHLVAGLDLRRAVTAAIRDARPDIVVSQSPDRRWDRIYASHPDHMAVGEATACAVYPDARNPFAFPDLVDAGLEPHTVGRLWVMSATAADRHVDITSTVDRKIAALRAHTSQTAEYPLDELIRGWGRATAEEAGWPDGSFAEGFRDVVTA